MRYISKFDEIRYTIGTFLQGIIKFAQKDFYDVPLVCDDMQQLAQKTIISEIFIQKNTTLRIKTSPIRV
jgi:hypothetical protein